MAAPSSLYSILTSIFAATAFLLAWASEFGCKFISFTSTSGFNQPVTVQFGIWTYQFWTVASSVGGSVVFETCHAYPSSVGVDSNWRAARAFSTLAVLVGGIFLFANLITACITPLRKTSRAEAPIFILACFFQGMALLFLNSAACKNNTLVRNIQNDLANLGNTGVQFPETCSISTGAKCTISAVVFWFLAAMASCVSLREEKKEDERNVITEPLIPGENL